MQYIHFTDLKGARGIKSTSTILGSSYGPLVFLRLKKAVFMSPA